MNKYYLTFFSKDVVNAPTFIKADRFDTNNKGWMIFFTDNKVTALFEAAKVAINHIEYGESEKK